ncbi:winged helix-turn-helix domain-containing protein [Methanocella conradii]|uniref:winged helix-turn-helix domain-containing protein n=1 Tax=Methanocella conradii TaxID=1175444 RepID=UPI00157D6799|nr:winged helix-turn-helix domain-containing protein [Methanocella conradii]
MEKREFEILKTLSYAGSMDVLFTVTKGKTKFTDIMFETKLNPGILNRLLKALIASEVLEKDVDGYHLTKKGALIVSYTLDILALNGEKEGHRDLKEILSTKIEQKARA